MCATQVVPLVFVWRQLDFGGVSVGDDMLGAVYTYAVITLHCFTLVLGKQTLHKIREPSIFNFKSMYTFHCRLAVLHELTSLLINLVILVVAVKCIRAHPVVTRAPF